MKSKVPNSVKYAPNYVQNGHIHSFNKYLLGVLGIVDIAVNKTSKATFLEFILWRAEKGNSQIYIYNGETCYDVNRA